MQQVLFGTFSSLILGIVPNALIFVGWSEQYFNQYPSSLTILTTHAEDEDRIVIESRKQHHEFETILYLDTYSIVVMGTQQLQITVTSVLIGSSLQCANVLKKSSSVIQRTLIFFLNSHSHVQIETFLLSGGKKKRLTVTLSHFVLF